MGGNVTAINKKTGESIRAEKIPVAKIGRKNFIQMFEKTFKEINKLFYKKYKTKLWVDEKILANGFAYNGSTSFIMNPEFSDEEVVKYKPSAGDLDITVPEQYKEELWTLLDSLEGKDIVSGIKYMGSNKPTVSSIGEQINCVMLVTIGDIRVPCQVDFEFLEYEGDKPTEWAKFSHSSSFTDAKAGVKAVHHKYLIRALVGGASVRDDIVIATGKSTPEKITLTKSKAHAMPRMLKFSVSRGIRVAYEPMLDADNKIIEIDGKQVYKEIPSKNSTYETTIENIYKLAFQQLLGNEQDVRHFESFVGVIELMKKHLNTTQIQRTHDRYIELLWASKGERAQELEVGNPELDFQVKSAGYSRLIKDLNLKDKSGDYIDVYYKTYGTSRKLKESFRGYLKKLQGL